MVDDLASRNRLLCALSGADRELLLPALSLVDIPKGEVLTDPLRPIVFSWFPVSGVASVVATDEAGEESEVGVIGREGMVATATIHGIGETSLRTFMQIAGQALRMRAAAFTTAAAESVTLSRLMSAYAEAFSLQVASTALAFATRTIEERLARWLLMCDDRVDDGAIELTHESLALMLGVRRAGVTVALGALEARGLVALRRGGIQILDRAGLIGTAADSYGAAESDYARLIGAPGVVQAA